MKGVQWPGTPGRIHTEGSDVKFTVYLRPDDAYVFVPDCMVASREAERLHGPLIYCETIDTSDYPVPGIWETVMDEVDRQSFAVLHSVIGRRLLGLDCQEDRATA